MPHVFFILFRLFVFLGKSASTRSSGHHLTTHELCPKMMSHDDGGDVEGGGCPSLEGSPREEEDEVAGRRKEYM